MPSPSFTSSLPNSPPLFSQSSIYCRRPLYFFRPSKGRTASLLLTYVSHKGNVPPFQIIPFFNGAKSRKALSFQRNSKLPTNQETKLLKSVGENARCPTIEESRKSRFSGEAEKKGESSAENSEFLVEKNESLFVLATVTDRDEFGVAYNDSGALANMKGSDVSNAVEKCGDDFPQKEQALGNLSHKDGEFMGLGRRGSRFHVGNLVKKIMSLPDEERAKVLDLFELDDNHLTVSDYNDILMALVKAGEFISAEVLFSEFSLHGLSPDSWSFSIIIQCFCKKNDPDKAKELLDVMLQKGFHPNAYTFTGLINCLCKRGRLKMAYEVFDIMSKFGCDPTVRNYNSLIYGLCYVGKIEEALQLFNKIKNSKEGPDVYTFNFVMDGFCKVGRTEEARELLQEALKLGVIPTNATYNCLVNGYCKEGRPLEGLHLLKEMKGRDFEPDIISYTTLLQGLLKCGEIHAALGTYKEMRAAGFQVDERAMNTLVRGLCRQSLTNDELLKQTQELFKEITNKGSRPSIYTYCLMVQALAEGGEVDTAMAYMHKMVKDGYIPRIMTFNIILRILCGKGRVDDALGVLILMIERETMPSKFSFSILIDGFNKQGRLLEAAGVYTVAVKRGIFPYHKPERDWIYEKKISMQLEEAEQTE